MRRHVLRALSLAAALCVAGCDSFATAPADFDQGNIGGTNSTLRISNQTAASMTVYFSPCTDPEYGPPRGTVNSYSQRSWTVQPGCWDVAVDASGFSFGDERITIAPSQTYTLEYSP